MQSAAAGFRAHSGWAAAVAIAGQPDAPVVIARRRIQMVEAAGPRATQPYHAAAGRPIEDAQAIVHQAAATAARLAGRALAQMLEELRGSGYELSRTGLLLAAGRPLPALPAILASHALIHAAEGELFREALRIASAASGLRVVAVKERDLPASVPDAVQQQVNAIGRTIGPPWRQDEKFSAMAAWLALHRAP